MDVRIPSAPILHPENQAYFDAAGQGRLLVKHCGSCGAYHHYPRALCPFCMAPTDWTESPGTGRIYSFSVTRRGVPIPYVVAYVTLDKEGITMMANIVDTDFEQIRVGDAVKVVFKTSEDGQTRVPCFTRVAAQPGA